MDNLRTEGEDGLLPPRSSEIFLGYPRGVVLKSMASKYQLQRLLLRPPPVGSATQAHAQRLSAGLFPSETFGNSTTLIRSAALPSRTALAP